MKRLLRGCSRECTASETYLFADDTKLYKEVKGVDDNDTLQRDLVKLETWSEK